MLKKFLCGALLCAGVVSAHAAEQLYTWSYTGFTDADTGVFLPNKHIWGEFLAEDLNADGELSRSELKTFMFLGRDHRYSECGADPMEAACELSDFSYKPGGPLTFNLSGWSDVQHPGGEHIFFAWALNAPYSLYEAQTDRNDPAASWSKVYNFSDETRFSISPVPEPQAYVLFGVGLLGVAAAARRRRAPV